MIRCSLDCFSVGFWPIGQSVGCLISRLVGRLVGVSRLIRVGRGWCRSVERPVGRSRSVGWSAGRSVGQGWSRSVGVGRSVVRSVDHSVGRSVGPSAVACVTTI